MRKGDVTVGGVYRSTVSGRAVSVRVDRVTDRWDPLSRTVRTRYEVTNLRTGRRLTFRSAQRLRPVLETVRAAENALRASGETALADDVYALGVTLGS